MNSRFIALVALFLGFSTASAFAEDTDCFQVLNGGQLTNGYICFKSKGEQALPEEISHMYLIDLNDDGTAQPDTKYVYDLTEDRSEGAVKCPGCAQYIAIPAAMSKVLKDEDGLALKKIRFDFGGAAFKVEIQFNKVEWIENTIVYVEGQSRTNFVMKHFNK